MTRRLDGLVLAQRHHLRHSVRRRFAAAVNQDRRGLALPVLPNRVTCSSLLLRCKVYQILSTFGETNSNKEQLPTNRLNWIKKRLSL